MKTVVATAVLAISTFAAASDSTTAFDKLKALAGTWTGNASVGTGKMLTKVVYRVVSGGNAVEEEIGPGTSHEMITIYYLDEGSLVMTHYCEMGNQPHMKFKEGDGTQTLAFVFAGGTNIPPGAGHMHSLKLHLLGPDHIEAVWMAQQGDKPMFTVDMDLHRHTMTR